MLTYSNVPGFYLHVVNFLSVISGLWGSIFAVIKLVLMHHTLAFVLRLYSYDLLFFLFFFFLASWQDRVHGWQLWPQTRRGIRVPHHCGGVAQRDAGPRHLQRQVQVHRRRQTRSSLLGVEPHYQERLERLISPSPSSINVFLRSALLSSFSRCHSIFFFLHLDASLDFVSI